MYIHYLAPNRNMIWSAILPDIPVWGLFQSLSSRITSVIQLMQINYCRSIIQTEREHTVVPNMWSFHLRELHQESNQVPGTHTVQSMPPPYGNEGRRCSDTGSWCILPVSDVPSQLSNTWGAYSTAHGTDLRYTYLINLIFLIPSTLALLIVTLTSSKLMYCLVLIRAFIFNLFNWLS